MLVSVSVTLYMCAFDLVLCSQLKLFVFYNNITHLMLALYAKYVRASLFILCAYVYVLYKHVFCCTCINYTASH